MSSRKKDAAPPAKQNQSFGISIAAALALTVDEALDGFTERANVRKLCFIDQGKFVYSIEKNLPKGQTVYSLLRARGVAEGSIQNAKRAADIIADFVGTELVTEKELDSVITHLLCVNIKKCQAQKIPNEAIAELIKAPNAAAEIECLGINGKTLSAMNADAAEKAAAEKAAAEKKAADDKAAAEAAAAQAATEKAAAEKASAAATAAAAQAAADKAAAEKLAAENAAKEKDLDKKSKDTAAEKAAAAAEKAAAEKASAAAAAAQAAAEKQAAENAAKEKELAEKNAEAEKRLAELAAAEAAAAEKAAAAPPADAVKAATKQAVDQLMSGRDGKLPSPDEILNQLCACLSACFNLPMDKLATVPAILLTAAEEIDTHLAAAATKAA